MNSPDVPQKLRVLIVEDEALIAEEIQGRLARLGFETSAVADTSEKAIDAARKTEPDLVLMDIRLKGATDGIETASLIRRTLKLPVIYVTAHSDHATLMRAKETNPFGYILKPFREPELLVTIEMATHMHAMECRAEESMAKLMDVSNELEDACGHISMLQKLVPICKDCNCIRSDTAYWQELDEAVRNRSQFELSNTRCPDCKIRHTQDNAPPPNSEGDLVKVEEQSAVARPSTACRLVVYLGNDTSFFQAVEEALTSLQISVSCVPERLTGIDELISDWYRVLIIDLDDEPSQGIEVLRAIKSICPHLPVFLAGHPAALRPTRVWLAQNHGADGLLVKPKWDIHHLRQMVSDEFRKHDRWLGAHETSVAMLNKTPRIPTNDSGDFDELSQKLSPREKQIMELLVSGLLPKTIAAKLKVSPKTVEHHRANVLRKMKVDSVVELVRLALVGNRRDNDRS